jgi:threonine/homoserine/homoserine lactone efflux protein
MTTIENRIRHAWIGLIGVAVAAVGLVFVAVLGRLPVGFSFPRHFLLFSLLGDAYCIGFLVWLLKRLKKQQSAVKE